MWSKVHNIQALTCLHQKTIILLAAILLIVTLKKIIKRVGTLDTAIRQIRHAVVNIICHPIAIVKITLFYCYIMTLIK